MPIHLRNDRNIFFDCDDTLVMWNQDKSFKRKDSGALKFIHSESGTIFYLKPNKKHIELLKEYAKKGYQVIVWSAGGSGWAHDVTKQLGLNDHVYATMSKPIAIVDDMPIKNLALQRIYIKEEKNEKN